MTPKKKGMRNGPHPRIQNDVEGKRVSEHLASQIPDFIPERTDTIKEDNNIDIKEEPNFEEAEEFNVTIKEEFVIPAIEYTEEISSVKNEILDDDCLEKVNPMMTGSSTQVSTGTDCNELCDISKKDSVKTFDSLEDAQEKKKACPRYQCSLCTKSFKSEHCLETHVAGMHEKCKPYGCATCNKWFTQKGTLNQHIRSFHKNIKRFQCGLCEKSFSHKGHRNRHMATHNGALPYKCDLCKKEFSQKENLKRHLLVVHERTGRVECPLCFKTFTEKGSLRYHMFTHSGEKQFGCHNCQKRFNRKNLLIKHIAQRHSKRK